MPAPFKQSLMAGVADLGAPLAWTATLAALISERNRLAALVDATGPAYRGARLLDAKPDQDNS